MKLYLLTRKEDFEADWDEYRGFVICGLSAQDAREQAYGVAKVREDNPDVWLKVDNTSCMVIGKPSGPITEPQIILSDFKSG